MNKKQNLSPETLVAQANHAIDPISGGVVPPIQPATTFSRDKNYQLLDDGTEYTRDDNPTYKHAESVLCGLENGDEALLFSSGMAAITTLFRTLKRGEQVVAPSRMYFGVIKWLMGYCAQHEISLKFYDPQVSEQLKSAVRSGPTKLIWVETPANPSWEITSIRQAASLANDAGAELAVDNTVPTPVHTNPLTLGADYVFHSGTKYLNGHSDVLAGALVTNSQTSRWQEIKDERHNAGAVLGPFEAWLLLRGMRTLFVRVRHSSASAMKIASHFEDHPKLERVSYPGLVSHSLYEVASEQMRDGFGGMLALLVKGGPEGSN